MNDVTECGIVFNFKLLLVLCLSGNLDVSCGLGSRGKWCNVVNLNWESFYYLF